MQQMQIETAVAQPATDSKQPPRFFGSGISWPELFRLAGLWHAKRRGRFMPARSDFDPLELKPWLGWMSLVRVGDCEDDAEFVFTIYGTNMAWTTGLELQGKTTDALPPACRLPVVESYRLACRLRRPLFSAMIVRNDQRRVLERVILPLSSDGQAVDRLLIGIGQHEIEDQDVAAYRRSLQGCDVAVAIIDP